MKKLPYYLVKLNILINGDYQKLSKHFVRATSEEYPEQSAIHQAILNESHQDPLHAEKHQGFILSRFDGDSAMHYTVSSCTPITDETQIQTLKLYL